MNNAHGNYKSCCLIIAFIFLSSHCIYSQEPPQLKNQILAGANYFPLVYLEFFSPFSDANGVLYGYHLTYVRKLKKTQIRFGINGNYFGRSVLSLGIEIGIEKLIASKNGKWNFKYGPDLFLAKWIAGYPKSIYTFSTKSFAFGIVGSCERQLSQRFHLFTEVSFSVGYWYKWRREKLIDSNWEIKSYRFLGIGVGYSF